MKLSVWARTGLTVGVIDALWAVVLTAAYGRSQAALWQGVASVPFGQSMLTGGTSAVFVGLMVHFGVAFFWSAVFLAAHASSPALQRATRSPLGVALVAMVYGPLIWTLMSLVFIPLRTGNPAPAITGRWLIQFAGHMCFVGYPIVRTVARAAHGTNAPR
ncbi:MAG: hypothetical protein HYV19_11570 [Gemmatimonadetes bacterium]|nr:hypothetical protein [Gemmatimonadota bacterium]